MRAHLDGWVGRKHEALVEQPGMARLPDFTEVRVVGGEPADRKCSHWLVMTARG